MSANSGATGNATRVGAAPSASGVAGAPAMAAAAGGAGVVQNPAKKADSQREQEVTIRAEGMDRDLQVLSTYDVDASEVQTSAGTFGDVPRYVQLLPGVVFDSDERNDFLVRGGNPIENLFIVNGIEIPNMNHLASSGSTGGLVSMLDTNALKSLQFHTGAYGARYTERLSSVTDMTTRESVGDRFRAVGEIGFAGAGAISSGSIGRRGDWIFAARQSFLNMFTQDVGLNGVPIYLNLLNATNYDLGPRDRISILSLSGRDSIKVHPSGTDWYETVTEDTQYYGWRSTDGLTWQHLFSSTAYGRLAISDTEQKQNINQTDQMLADAQVYRELTRDGITTVKYDFTTAPSSAFQINAGANQSIDRVNYDVMQPVGQQTPYSVDPTRSDATSFSPRLNSTLRAGYLEAIVHPASRVTFVLGGRVQHWGFNDHTIATPRATAALRLTDRISVRTSYGQYAQLPPFLELTAYPQNYHLEPIRATHVVAGADMVVSKSLRLTLEGYRKTYRDYPVSTEYPSLSLANVADTFGTEFLWFPMSSAGVGQSTGVELSAVKEFSARWYGQANLAYSRTRFAALDGVLRPGNYDYPVALNVAGGFRPGHKLIATVRYTYYDGKPYTPYIIDQSHIQQRGIYDLTQVNALRAPFYSRFDFRVERPINIHDRPLTVWGGLDNAFDRSNFLAYLWRPRCPNCYAPEEETQLPLFPDFGLRYAF